MVPRTRNYREKSEKSPVVYHTEEKQQAREAALERIKNEQRLLKSYIKGSVLDFKALPVIERVMLSEYSPMLNEIFTEDRVELPEDIVPKPSGVKNALSGHPDEFSGVFERNQSGY